MKQGQTLPELVGEINRLNQTKHDYLASTQLLTMRSNHETTPGIEPGQSTIFMPGSDGSFKFSVNENAHAQIASHLGIPKAFYDRLRGDIPGLLDDTVNTLFRHKPEQRLIRTADNTVRAFMSHKYRALDNYDLMDVIGPELLARDGLELQSAAITDRKLYLKIVNTKLEAEVKSSRQVGDYVQGGIILSNSEVGAGALSVQPFLFRLVCLNGATVDTFAQRRSHIGRSLSDLFASQDVQPENGAIRIYKDETLAADDKAFWLRVRDTVNAAVNDQDQFQKIVEAANEAAKTPTDGNPEKVVEVVSRQFALNERERGGFMKHLIEGGDVSKWGFANAITRASQDVDDYERATELERAGGAVIQLPRFDWEKMTGDLSLN